MNKELYEWINSCPLNPFVYEDEDGTIIIELRKND